MKSKPVETVLYIFIVLAIVLSLVSFSLIAGRMGKTSEAEKLAEEENRPARLELVKITDSSCADCFDIDGVVNDLRKPAVNITSERSVEFSSSEAMQLIEKYDIRKLPTLLVSGEINKSNVANIWTQDWDVAMENNVQVSYVYAGQAPPYRDLEQDKVLGLVTLTRLVDSSCDQCSSVDPIINSFKQAGAVFISDRTVEYTSDEGNALINTYGVKEIPAVVISKDITDYPQIAEIWPRLNVTEKNGFYALHVLQPPYRNLSANKIVGLVDVIYLNDSSCGNCYNVLVHKIILGTNFGVSLVNETVVDVNSTQGKELVSRYNITVVPVFIMSPEAKYYSGLMQVWLSVGTTESNSWYVFRNVDAIGGIYKNLTSGKVVVPAS